MEISKKKILNFKLSVLQDYSIISVEILSGAGTGIILLIVELLDNIFVIPSSRKCGIIVRWSGIKVQLSVKCIQQHFTAPVRDHKSPRWYFIMAPS